MSRPFAFLTRRRFLYGGLGAAALLGSTAAGAWWVRGDVAAVSGLKGLTAAEFRTLSNLVGASFPAGGAIPVDASDIGVARAFDGFFADLPEPQQTDLSRALTLVELAPLIWSEHRTTFSRLAESDRAEYWATWGASDRLLQRQVSLAFRKFMNMVFYDAPQVWPHIGYGGPSLKRRTEGTR